MTAILTHVTTEGEQELLPFAKMSGNYSDHDRMFKLGDILTGNIRAMQQNGMMDLQKYKYVYVHDFVRDDGKIIDDYHERSSDISITMFGSNENLAIKQVYSPDEGYTYSFEQNGGLDGTIWGLTVQGGQAVVQPIERGGRNDSILPGHLRKPFEALLGYMNHGMKL
ncbi:hypothetical protein pEaSNUABM38_00001 [Erwinia phage pEa_SNUABM_38]|nr:hypothetical protein pEaSNUABM38_00001 [Erwinia phage pEa_SNUABM_38]